MLETQKSRQTLTDANGVVTAYRYDAQSRLTSVTEGYVAGPGSGADVNVTTSYAYTAVGNVASITDPKGAVTAFTYDLLGRTLTETNPLGRVWQYVYDAAGRVTSELDAKGQTTGYSYTDRGDVAVIDYASGADVTFEYDAAQNLITMTDGLGASGWVYDDAGRITQQTDSNGSVLSYGYDATGARTELELPNGTVTFEYDDAGRPVLQTSPWGSLGYAYDPAGNLTDVLRSNGLTSTYEYDDADRVTSITHTSPGSELGCDLGANDIEVGVDIETLIALDLCLTIDLDIPVLTGLDYGDSIELDYGYDPVGNVTSQTRKDGSAPAVATTYGYDDLHRLVSSATSDGVDNSYVYDRAGNRTQWVTDHAPDTGAALTVNATYDTAGQLTKEVKTSPGLLGPSTKTTNYSYDANGNRTRMKTGSAVTDYSYTADDRLSEIDQGLREVEHEHDGLGRALTETVRSLLVLQSETEQLWDGMVVVAQSAAAGTTSLVRDVLGDVALQSTPGLLDTDSRWGLTDRLGSTIGQAQGSKVGQLAEYSDWGVPTFGTLGWNSETGYTGELGDTTSGLVNFYARSYDPMAGSWLQADPYRGTLTDPQSLNRYGYVTGNPTTHTDAFGYAVTNRMLHDSSGGGHARAAQLASLARQEAAMVNRLDPNGAKRAAAAASPRNASNTTDRHGREWWEIVFAFPHDVTGGFLQSAWNTAVGIWDYAPLNYILQAVFSGPQAAWEAFDRKMMQTALAALAAVQDPGGTAVALGKDLVAWDMWATNPGGALGSVGFNAASLLIPGGAGVAIKGTNVVTRVTTTAARACSFSAATAVLLADGTTKAIADIEVGDEVLAADPVTGEQAAEEVTHLWVHDDDLVDLATSAGVVTTTEDHPFWNDTDQQWQPAEELDAGDRLSTDDGGSVTVVGLDEDSVQEGMAYNLTVDRIHTYYVAIGEAATLVHNTCPVDPSLGRGSTGSGPQTPREQAAIDQVMANPQYGNPIRGLTLTDPRWPAQEGWVKMERVVDGVVIHWNRNEVTGEVDDFKIK